MKTLRHSRTGCLSLAVALLAGCGGTTIRPDYTSTNPNLRIGGDEPADSAPTIENAGAFCLEVQDVWHEDGRTPDGERLFARDTLRRVVSCSADRRG